MGSYCLRFAFFHLTTAHSGALSPPQHRTFPVFVVAQSFIVRGDYISLHSPCWGQTGCVQFGCVEGPYTRILCSSANISLWAISRSHIASSEVMYIWRINGFCQSALHWGWQMHTSSGCGGHEHLSTSDLTFLSGKIFGFFLKEASF